MNSIFVAVHSDDEALFGSLICLRYKPLVVIVTDSFIQYERGQTTITAHRRRDETRAACETLGVECRFAGIADSSLNEEYANVLFEELTSDDVLLFVPARQGGNPHHDLIADVFGGYEKWHPIVKYSTYAKDEWATLLDGGIVLHPTDQELDLKKQAIACYASQSWQGHMQGIADAGYVESISRLP